MMVVYCDLFSWKLGYTNTVSIILLIKVNLFQSLHILNKGNKSSRGVRQNYKELYMAIIQVVLININKCNNYHF